MDEVVDVAAGDPGSPSGSEAVAEPETTSVDAAEAGAQPSNDGENDPAVRWAKSRGHLAFDDRARRALGEDHYRVLNDNARLAKERAEYATRLEKREAELEQLRAIPKAPPTPTEPPPDLKKLLSHITALKADIEDFPKHEQKLFEEFDKARVAAIRYQARLDMAEDFDKPSWQSRIDLESQRMAAVRQAIERLPRERRLFEVELERAERDREGRETHYADQERARQQAGEVGKAFEREFPADVDNLITKHATELKVDGVDNPEFVTGMLDIVSALVMREFQRHPGVKLSDYDLSAMIRSQVERWAKSHDLIKRVQLRAVSQIKTQPSKISSPQLQLKQPYDPFTTPPPTEEELRAERQARIQRAVMSR